MTMVPVTVYENIAILYCAKCRSHLGSDEDSLRSVREAHAARCNGLLVDVGTARIEVCQKGGAA